MQYWLQHKYVTSTKKIQSMALLSSTPNLQSVYKRRKNLSVSYANQEKQFLLKCLPVFATKGSRENQIYLIMKKLKQLTFCWSISLFL